MFVGIGKILILRVIFLLVLGDKKGLYLVFNKKIVDEVFVIFFSNVECRIVYLFVYRVVVN